VRRGDRGATTVEFALVVPLFFVLIGITAFFAWQLFTEAQLERAAQRAARYAAVPTTEGGYAYRHCDLVDSVNDHLHSFDVPATAVEVNDADGALAPTACPSATVAGRPRGYVHVRVTHELDNPFADVLTFLLARQHPLTITGSGEARVEDTT
jgi:hypothetical protein